MAVYTSGDWYAKPGKESEFVEVWREMAEWTGAEFDMDGWAKLLRDKEDPTYFRSVAEWADEKVVEQWRTSDGFKQRMAKARELLTDMRIHAMDAVVEVETK